MAKRFEKPATGDAAGSKRNASDKRSSTKRSDKNSEGEKKVYNRREKPARSGDRPFRDKESFGEGRKPRTGGAPERGNRYAGKSDDRRSRSEEGAPRKTYGRKPFAKEGNDDRRRTSSDRPQRRDSFSKEGRSDDRPYKGKSFSERGSSDRPNRGKSFSDRGERSFDNKGRSGGGYAKRDDRNGNAGDRRPAKPYQSRNAEGKPFTRRDNDSEAFSGKRGEKPRFEERGNGKPYPKRNTADRPFKKEFSDKEGGERKGRFADKPELKERKKRNEEVLGRFKNNRAEVSPEEAPNYKIKPSRSRRVEKALEKDEKDGKIRLNRYIANAGICSRREADSLIASGEIKVNGEIVTEMGYLVNPSDNVQYGRKVLNRQKMVYVLLNKPKDFITTTEDPEGRKTVMDLVGNATDERIFPVGRLDRNTTGLLLFTNDGELAQKLTHPAHKTGKIYQVELDKPITNEDFKKIAEGLELEDGKADVDDVAILSTDKKFLGLEIHIGRNRIVRRIFEHLGYDVVTLDRVQFASLTKKDLPRGKWRFLNEKEVIRLKYFM